MQQQLMCLTFPPHLLYDLGLDAADKFTRAIMPGSSLWLVPPEDSELYKTVHDLIINQFPSVYPIAIPPHFAPHITLTSGINERDAESSDPQKWLDGITFPDLKDLKVAIQDVEVGSVFFKKVTMKCEKTADLSELAATCRAAGVEGLGKHAADRWVEESYLPHCSLM